MRAVLSVLAAAVMLALSAAPAHAILEVDIVSGQLQLNSTVATEENTISVTVNAPNMEIRDTAAGTDDVNGSGDCIDVSNPDHVRCDVSGLDLDINPGNGTNVVTLDAVDGIGSVDYAGGTGCDLFLAQNLSVNQDIRLGNGTCGGGFTQTGQAGSGSDDLQGGTNSDSFTGGGGTDTVHYETHTANLTFTLGAGFNDGGPGEGDSVGADIERFLLGSGNDTWTGDGDVEFVQGGEGEDTLTGNGGADTLLGEGDGDTLVGGDGGDTLTGAAGNNIVTGGNDADVITTLEGNDIIDAGPGGGPINAGGGNNTVTGGDGVDGITIGGAGTNQVDGGAGSDTVNAAGGNNTVTGGDGVDVINIGGTGTNQVDGGTGNDTVTTQGGPDTLTGGPGDDGLTAGAGVDSLDGGDGVDTLTGADGVDTLEGRTGADVLHGGPGDDTLRGHEDDDVLNGDGDADSLDGGSGADVLNGGDGADPVLEGGTEADSVDGGTGNDAAVNGGEGDDTVTGGDGDDGLNGGIGDDDLFPGDGADNALAGPGDDTIADSLGPDIIDGGEGTIDAIGYGATEPVFLSLDTLPNDGRANEGDNLLNMETLTGGTQADVITGDGAVNFLNGGDGDDRIDGLGGIDILRGNLGNDTVIGRDDQLVRDDIGCNDGLADTAIADANDIVAYDCETVDRAAPPAGVDPSLLGPSGLTPGSDTTPPKLTVTGAPRRIAKPALLAKGVAVSVGADEPVKLDVRLIGKANRAQVAAVRDVVLAQANRGLSGATRRVRLKPSRKLLGRRATAKLRIAVVGTDAAGNRSTVRRKLTVAAKKRN